MYTFATIDKMGDRIPACKMFVAALMGSYNRGLWACLIIAALSAGCGQDPIEQRAAELASQKSRPGSGAQSPPPGGPPSAGSEGGTIGIPEEPSPGIPDEPPPGQPLGGSGPQITLSGEVQIKEWSGAPIRVDIFDGNQQDLAGPRPSVVGVVHLDAPGPWSVGVSTSISQLWIGAYSDENKDGKPDHSEPVGWYAGNPVAGGADRGDLTLSLAVPPPE
jgi:hypothetical protein